MLRYKFAKKSYKDNWKVAIAKKILVKTKIKKK